MKLHLLTGLVCLIGSAALAHEGPRVWLSQQDGQIVPLASDDDYAPQNFSPAQVFFTAFDEFENEPGALGPVKQTTFPGFETRRDGLSNIADGALIGFDLAGPLLKLNPAGDKLVPTSELFGSSQAPQLEIARADGIHQRVTGSGVQAGFDFLVAGPSEHGHLFFTLLGDGVTAGGGPDGVYALPLRVTSDVYATSPWIFLLLQSNNTAAQRVAATNVALRMANATPGDTNFDGAVGFTDLLTLAQHYNQPSGAWWGTGDFDFDGAVAFTDLLAIAQHYQGANFTADWAMAQALTPEPVVALSVVLLLSTARRSRSQPHRRAAATGFLPTAER